MEASNRRNKPKYNRVMSRVYSKTRVNSKPSFSVTRHDSTSSRVGGKPPVLNVSSSVFSELPLVLDDYIPDEKIPKRTTVIKPKRTLKSLDPVKPPVSVDRDREVHDTSRNIRVPMSMPSFLDSEAGCWSDSHVRQFCSSRSQSKLQELKTEIRAYKEKEDLLKLRSRLYKCCGVVLDDAGRVAEDKAVQAEGLDSTPAETKMVPYHGVLPNNPLWLSLQLKLNIWQWHRQPRRHYGFYSYKQNLDKSQLTH